jgi:peroxiredoxin
VPIQQLPATAPDFTLDHIAGHEVSLSDFRGQRFLILFGGRESAQQVKDGIATLRQTHLPDSLTVVGVSDLRAAPRPARILVKSQLKKAYEEAIQANAADLERAGRPAPADPSTDVVMLMDWSGEVVDSYGAVDVEKEAAAVLVAADGTVIGSGTGTQLAEQIVALLDD